MPNESERSQFAVTPGGDPILAAKLRVPNVPSWVVARPRLLDRVSHGVEGPLTLLSAPAGTGKTVLASSWAGTDRSPGPVVWVSLDEEDAQPGMLWSYVLAGLTQAGVPVRQVGLPDQSGDADRSLLVRLAACLSELAQPVVLILDSVEFLTGPAIPAGIDFLIRHAAPQLRLILIGRFGPALPLHRYRLAGLVTELRLGDLAFAANEIEALLATHDTRLPESEVTALAHRTRGWAAGVRLAALALQRGPDTGAGGGDWGHGGRGIVGSDGNTVDYFVAEVLDPQPPGIRDFLLRTSVADQLWSGLAVELSGRPDAPRTLARLAQAGTFVVPAQAGGDAYEYHPLVRDLLRTQLQQEAPQTVERLHRTAARWFAGAGHTSDAVVHSCAAADWEDASSRVISALSIGHLIAGEGSGRLAGAFAGMPEGVPGPSAAVVQSALALGRGDLDACAKHLLRANEQLAAQPPQPSTALRLAGAIVEATRARLQFESAPMLSAVATSEALIAEMAAQGRTPSADLTALIRLSRSTALLYHGEFRAAADALTSVIDTAMCGRLRLECLGLLALLEALQGNLRRAIELGGKAGVVAGENEQRFDRPDSTEGLPLAADLALAWVHTERHDLPAARLHADRTESAIAIHRDPVATGVLAIVRARIQRARGDLGGAVAHLDSHAASRLCEMRETPRWLSDRLAMVRCGLAVASGVPDNTVGYERPDEVPTSPEYAVVHAYTQLSGDHGAGVAESISPLLDRQDIPVDLRVEAWLLAAACELSQGCAEGTRAALDRALRLAAPERLRRPVFEVSPRLRRFLRQSTDLTEQHSWLGSTSDDAFLDRRRPARSRTEVERAPVVESLTEKETEVLRYLAALLSTEEIARTMFVSVNTVKTHIRGVLRKLAVSRRNEAVRRARQLGLVDAIGRERCREPIT